MSRRHFRRASAQELEMVEQPVEKWFNHLTTWESLEELVSEAQEEDSIFEVTSVDKPQLSKNLKTKIGKSLSGFANSRGGILLIGGITRQSAETGRDVLIDLAPIGNAAKLSTTIDGALSRMTTPDLPGCKVRTVKNPNGNAGCILVFVPQTPGDPIQSHDDLFYWRTATGFSALPYSLIRRMFAATDVPDLRPGFAGELVSLNDDATWTLPIVLENYSSAVAEHVVVSVEISNPENTVRIVPKHLKDVSNINPGRRLYSREWPGVIHRGLGAHCGTLDLVMASPKGRPKRVLDIRINCFANRMTATRFEYRVRLEKSGFKVDELDQVPLY